MHDEAREASSVDENGVEASGAEAGGAEAAAQAVGADAAPAGGGPGAIADRVEALLLSTERPLAAERIAVALGLMTEGAAEARAAGAVVGSVAAGAGDAAGDAVAGAGDAAGDAGGEARGGGKGGAGSRKRGRRDGGKAQAAARSQAEDALARVGDAVAALNASYERTGRSFRVEAVAGGYRVMTLSRYAADIARLRSVKVSARLSRAAVETLAIIAYKQPITRAELEAIRGVSCGEVLKSLLERRLVTIKGRAEELGRPMLYGTTREFLDHFGLASIKDLPTIEELRAGVGS
jgi:segregation and condensation protein B